MTALAPLDIMLEVAEPAGLERSGEPVRTGVPLPRGLVREAADLLLQDESGGSLPLQTRALARWPDGSLKWVLLDTPLALPARGKRTLHLRQGQGATGHKIRITESPEAIEIDTSVIAIQVPRKGSSLLSSVKRAGREQLAGDGLRIDFRDGRRVGRKARIDGVRIEERGALLTCIAVEGIIAGTALRRPLEFLARLTLFAGSGVLDAEFRIRNPRRARHRGGLWDLGDPGSQLVSELALVFNPANQPQRIRWLAVPGETSRETDAQKDWTLYQDSSGGDNWNSPNHVGADGRLTVSFRGYQVRGEAGAVLESGNRATPCVELDSGSDAIACSVDGFWQNFPKALRVHDGTMHIGLFPFETRTSIELQGGEQKRHRLWIAFGNPGEGTAELLRRLQPLQVRLDPRAIEESGVLPTFAAPHPDDDPRYLAYMHSIIEGENSFFAGRETIDEYGWRNFGDVYADHEAVNHKGPDLFISHYNNQYDVVLGTLLQGLRSGDARWFELARDLARHVADIDIYHTQDDKPAYNGGLFWHSDHHLPAGLATHRTYSRVNAQGSYGGGPDNEHIYTSGLLLYHYLTGDPEAAEAVLSLANYVIAMDDGSRTLLRFLDGGPTGNASKTVSMDFHGPGRGAGNAINALIDGFALTDQDQFLSKAEELIRRCINPYDDFRQLSLDDPEKRWSYLVFLQTLAKYLRLKYEHGALDSAYCHARASLLHYAAWMVEHERPYQEQLHRVLLPTETWPAQDVRKLRILTEAAAYSGHAEQCRRIREAAAIYRERSIVDVLAFPTSGHVRPRVLLAAYGSARDILAGKAQQDVVLQAAEIKAKAEFVGQRRRVMNLLLRRWLGR